MTTSQFWSVDQGRGNNRLKNPMRVHLYSPFIWEKKSMF